MPSADSALLSDGEWERHQRIIAGFETAWKRGERPKIGAHLPPDEPRRDELLVELVHADLEFRIKAGESARVEDYLRKYPGLARVRETVLGLIRAECSIRRRKEPALKMERYRQRFPEYLAELETPRAEATTVTEPPNLADPKREGRKAERKVVDRKPPDVELPLPRRFGKFELREKLGLGSFGVVYRAWDTVLRREVAVKVPRAEVAAAKLELRAFLREARNAVGLQHPNIVAILDAGPIEGVDCLVRAFIKGITLEEKLREGQFTPEEAAAMGSVVADAVDYANRSGIIHRDLKPSNILLDLEGRPHVSDFGLAKREASDTTLSPSGTPGLMIGTLAYMAPEQARGETYLVDARSDVYSLGVVLYELLTGSLPFRGRGRMLQIQIQDAEPLPPRSLNDEIPVDLETICLKALAKDPEDRYQAAGAMADDLRNFLNGEPVGAKPDPGPRSAPSPWWKSRGSLASLSAGLALSIALVTTTALWLRAEARRARDAEGLDQTFRALLGLAGAGETRAIGRGGSARGPRELAEDLAPALEGDPGLVEVAADARMGLADRATAGGADREAGPSWARAIAACEASLRDRPGQAPRLGDLARATSGLAEVRRRADDRAGSRALLERSLAASSQARAILEGRTSRDPADVDARLNLAEVLVRAAEVEGALGRSTGVREVEAIARDLVKQSWPGPPGFRRRLARLMLDLSRWQLAEGRPRLAEASASTAIGLGTDAGSGAGPARASLALARANRDLGRARESADLYVEAVRRFEDLVRAGPGRPEDRRDLGGALFEAGRLLDRAADQARAIDRYRRSLRVRLALVADHPGAHADLVDLAEVREALARDLEAEGRVLLAAWHRLAAIRDRARALCLAPGESSYRRALGESGKGLARGLGVGRLGGSR